MNGKNLLQSMTEIDQTLIEEAENVKIPQKKNKNIIRTISVIAAAALMSATAGAVSDVFSHRETVENFLYGNSREQLEEMGLVSNYVTENEHFRMTMETILYDGYRLYMIATLEAIDEAAQEFMALHGAFSFSADICYTDTGELIDGHGSGCFRVEDGKNLIEIERILFSLDTSRSVQMQFQFYGSDYTESDNALLEGLEVPIDFTPNLDSVEFKNESGQIVILTPLELYSEEQSCLTDPNHRIYMIKNNGKRVEINDDFEMSGLSGRGGADTLRASEILNPDAYRYSYQYFDKLMDIDDYKGIEFYNRNTNTSVIYEKDTE